MKRCSVGAVCENDPENLIKCSGDQCGIYLHPACYGLPEDTSFFKCESCEASAEPECILCPLRKGAFKRTKGGEWVHVLCAVYCPNVKFDNLETLSGIVVNKAAANSEKCRICEKSQGTCVSCNEAGCSSSVHVTCAQRLGHLVFAENEAEPYEAYCPAHGPKGQSTMVEAKGAGERSGVGSPIVKGVGDNSVAGEAGTRDIVDSPVVKETEERGSGGSPVVKLETVEAKAKAKDVSSGAAGAGVNKLNKERSGSAEGKSSVAKITAKTAPPKEKLSGKTETGQASFSGTKRERHTVDINVDELRKKRRLSSAAISAIPAKDAQSAFEELLQRQQHDLKALIRSRIGGNLDALATMAPDVVRLQESNKDLQSKIAALEQQRKDLREAKDKLKKKEGKVPEESGIGSNLLRGCLLAFGVLSPHDVETIETIKNHDGLVKLVAKALAEHSATKDDVSAADRQATFSSIISECVVKIKNEEQSS